MSDDILIGIDAGTSVIKSVAFTVTGEQIAVAAIPNSYASVGGGGVEQDMARTWIDTAATLRQLTERVPNLADRLIAIAVTAPGRRHVAGRCGRRAGGAGVAVARFARRLDRRGSDAALRTIRRTTTAPAPASTPAR